MPDHVHSLLEGTAPDSGLRQFAKDAKQYSGFHYKREYGKQLWQPSYYDHVLRDEEDTWSVARYIVENPLIAGLAEKADVTRFLVRRLSRRRTCYLPDRPSHGITAEADLKVCVTGAWSVSRKDVAQTFRSASGVRRSRPEGLRYRPCGARLGPRLMKRPAPFLPTNWSPSMITLPCDTTNVGAPSTLVPSYGL